MTMMRTSHLLALISALTLVHLGWSDHEEFEIGDTCGVNGADFLNDTFTGEYRVSGAPGCSIGSETDCYCSINFVDTNPVGDWIWQCNSATPGAVPFGPASGKVCPDEIPVPVGFVDDVHPFCDGSNPTGQAGDPGCAYSDCEDGGDFSALCGCVDLTFGTGGDNPGDLQWFCLHSTCHCPASEIPTTSSAPPVVLVGVLPLVLATASVLFL